ncbi:hypothetical protein Ae201684P_022181 [Aphanomyces euteiches]|nr:hypothetical protein Ae201684P_022181 [Aphanomyces euteiches]
MNTLFSKIAACRDTLDGYSGAYTMTSALKKLRSSLKRAKMESKTWSWSTCYLSRVKSKLLSSLDATVVQATCGVVASFARQLGAAFAPFADVLLVPLLDAACVRRKSADDDAAISMASTYCVEALAATTLLSVETLYAYFKTARATRNHRTEGGWKRHLVVKLLGITEFVREALHDNFLLVRVEARQVFSSLYDTWPERVNEFVYLPAPRIRAVLMADGYATTGIGLALQRKFQSKTPAAVKRDPPRWSVLALLSIHQRGGLSHAAGCAALGCAVHGDSGGMAAVAQFWTTHVKGRTTHARSTSVQGKLVPSWNRPSIQRCKRARRSHPLAPMDDVQVVNLLLR